MLTLVMWQPQCSQDSCFAEIFRTGVFFLNSLSVSMDGGAIVEYWQLFNDFPMEEHA